MRRVGHATDENGNAGDLSRTLSSQALDPINPSGTADPANILPDHLSSGAAANGATADAVGLPPSIADWLSNFRPFATSLSGSADDADGAPRKFALADAGPDAHVEANNFAPADHGFALDSQIGHDAVHDTSHDIGHDSLQKLFDHLSDGTSSSDHGTAPQAFLEGDTTDIGHGPWSAAGSSTSGSGTNFDMASHGYDGNLILAPSNESATTGPAIQAPVSDAAAPPPIFLVGCCAECQALAKCVGAKDLNGDGHADSADLWMLAGGSAAGGNGSGATG